MRNDMKANPRSMGSGTKRGNCGGRRITQTKQKCKGKSAKKDKPFPLSALVLRSKYKLYGARVDIARKDGRIDAGRLSGLLEKHGDGYVVFDKQTLDVLVEELVRLRKESDPAAFEELRANTVRAEQKKKAAIDGKKWYQAKLQRLGTRFDNTATALSRLKVEKEQADAAAERLEGLSDGLITCVCNIAYEAGNFIAGLDQKDREKAEALIRAIDVADSFIRENASVPDAS